MAEQETAKMTHQSSNLELDELMHMIRITAARTRPVLAASPVKQCRNIVSARKPQPSGRTDACVSELQLLDVAAVAAWLTCSERTVWRLSDAGMLPRPIRVGRLVRWTLKSINGWIEKGCPTVRAVSKKA